MKPAVSVRAYKKTDYKQLVRLQEELMDYFLTKDKAGIFRRQPDYGRRYTDYCLKEVKKHHGRVFVAFDGKQMVGFIIGAIYKKQTPLELSFYKPIKSGYVFMLSVSKTHQKHGVGRALMDVMETFFRKAGCDIVRLDATGSLTSPSSYYRRRGYQPWAVDMIKPLKRV